MNCPRCDSQLRQVEPGLRWQRHFICDDCEAAYRFEGSMLVRGRTANPSYELLTKLGLYIRGENDVVS